MRKTVAVLGASVLLGFSLLLIGPPDLLAQWGLIQQGVDAAKGGEKGEEPAPSG